ncbi:MAG: Peptidase M15, partial [uncultured Thiotrichaceae bacterium]
MLTKKLLLVGTLVFSANTQTQADQHTPQIPDAIDPNSAIAFLMGKAGVEDRFATIASRYASRKGMKLDPKAYEAFKQMHAAAQKDGIKLVIKSATRNFNYQKGIWERKWTGARKVDGQNLSRSMPDHTRRALKILENSSMPGSSRHHWGTDIDLNSFNN